jgi:hypothetical protein
MVGLLGLDGRRTGADRHGGLSVVQLLERACYRLVLVRLGEWRPLPASSL